MNLVIDQGNTYSKIAFFDNKQLIALTKEENSAIENIEAIIAQHRVEKAIIASVADAKPVINYLKQRGINFIEMNAQSHLPISIDYDTPQSLGLDRLAAATGAYQKKTGKNSLIIDIGTAVTYDICTVDGIFIGGSIAPGLDMRLQALHTFTKRLPLVERKWGEHNWAKSTKEALRNGAQEGIIAEINHYIAKAEHEFKEISVFLTGGDAFFFEKKIKNDIFVVPNLLLEGLLEILEIN